MRRCEVADPSCSFIDYVFMFQVLLLSSDDGVVGRHGTAKIRRMLIVVKDRRLSESTVRSPQSISLELFHFLYANVEMFEHDVSPRTTTMPARVPAPVTAISNPLGQWIVSIR